MGREVRMVPKGWQHPKTSNGFYQPLLKNYAVYKKEYLDVLEKEGRQQADDYFGCEPLPEDYMPEFDEGTADHFMMYEDTSEGTPISPAFPTPEDLAQWLADTNASSFADRGATYEQWLSTINRGSAMSAVFSTTTGMVSGVEFQSGEDNGK